MIEMPEPHVHVPYEKIEEYVNFINKHRLNLEIYFNSDSLNRIDAASISRLKDILDHSPSLSIHAPFMDLSPGAIDSFVRDTTVKRFNQVLDIAEMLKPLSIVFHSGYEKWKYALKIEPWLQKSIETWKPLIERAKHIGTKIAIENIFEDEPSNLKILMESIGSENFGICFDTGHCNLFTKVSPHEWLDALKPYIIELHLHDNDKSADQHRPMGDGSFDFKMLFSAMKNNTCPKQSRESCVYTIEAHSPEDVLKSLNKFKEYYKYFI